jgi:hypothetical protein
MWERLERGQKLIAAIVGISTIGGTISGGLVFMSRNAAASQISVVVAPLDKRVSTLETQRDGEVEWRRYLAEQVGQIAIRVGAPIAAPPPAAISKETR